MRQPALTKAIIVLLKHVPSYGGHLAIVVSTLLGDVFNHDPHVVHYLHEAGIASIIPRKNQQGKQQSNPKLYLPPVPELIMARPDRRWQQGGQRSQSQRSQSPFQL